MGYKYAPLTEPDCIRLIELQPALDGSAPIQCKLIHVNLSRFGDDDIFDHYMALSYVWGCPAKTRRVWINGTSLEITVNLFSGLRDIRDETRPLLLWADGICINQSDSNEKRLQIGIMGQIYSRALHTIIYLGPAAIDSAEFQCITALRQSCHRANADLNLPFASILSNEWFTRVWVFQELVFSTSPWIQCGRTRVKWSKFYEYFVKSTQGSTVLGKDLERGEYSASPASVFANNMRYRLPDSFETKRLNCFVAMQCAWEIHHSSSEGTHPKNGSKELSSNTMLELLRERRGSATSDTRDMVFAHVGFAADGQHDDLKVDYSKTSVQVFTDCARYLANKHGIETLLACVNDSKSATRLKGLPSWVPDWTDSIPTALQACKSFNSTQLTPRVG